MLNAESLLRTILGPIRPNIRPLIFAVEITDSLMFSQHISMDDILVTKHVYPDVAKMVHKSQEATSRAVERLALRCWDALQEQNLVSFYLGSVPKQAPTPGSLIVYLAVYAHLELPFTTAVNMHPELLISSQPAEPRTIPLVDPDIIRTALRLYFPRPVTRRMVFFTSTGTTSFPVCPECNITMEREYQGCCNCCGQHLDWKHYKDAEIVYPGQLIPHP